MMKKNIETNPEFASEVVLSIPYCYYLHQRGQLGKVTVCNGMKPFYYFADNVVEGFSQRSLDNPTALKDIPNKWLHHSHGVDGVIDYTEWETPPYKEVYRTDIFDDIKPFVIVNNIFNAPWLENGCLDIKSLYDIFTYLTESGYKVVYKRPENKEFILDQNEIMTPSSDITADVEGIGVITDYELCDYFENVININKLWKDTDLDYSTLNLNLFAETEGFITPSGAGSQLCAYFGKPIVMHVTRGREVERPGYLTHPDCFYKKLSNAPLHLIYDDHKKWNGNPSNRKYDELNQVVKKVFGEKK